MTTRFGEGLIKHERMPQTYKNVDPYPNIPFEDESNVVEFDWLEWIVGILLVGGASVFLVLMWELIIK